MYKKNLLLVVLIISVLVNGCALVKQNGDDSMKEVTDIDTGLNNDENDNEITKDKLATKEFIMDTFNLSEDDMKKYDIEEVISFYSLTEEFFLEEKKDLTYSADIINVLKLLQKDMNLEMEEKKYDFSYILEEKEYAGDYPDLSTIARIAVANYVADAGSSCVIDFEKDKIYYSFKTNSVGYDIRRAEEIYDLSAKEKEVIIAALEDAEVNKWKHIYESNDESTRENAFDFGIEFEDGTIITYEGIGTGPNSYSKLKDVLFGIR